MRKQRLISIDIDTGPYREFVAEILRLAQQRRSAYVCLANVHMLIEAWRDRKFAGVVNAADMVTPDGMPLAKAIRLLYGQHQDRVEGMRLLPDLIAAAAEAGVSVYFYGSSEEVLAGIRERLAREQPQLPLAGTHSPPFRQLSTAERQADIERLNASGAQLVFVSLGCPKQEFWMAQHRGQVRAVMVGIGGAFPVYAGQLRRAPAWMQKLALEWLYRLGQEPRRLWRRYLVTNTLFAWLLARAALRKLLGGKMP